MAEKTNHHACCLKIVQNWLTYRRCLQSVRLENVLYDFNCGVVASILSDAICEKFTSMQHTLTSFHTSMTFTF